MILLNKFKKLKKPVSILLTLALMLSVTAVATVSVAGTSFKCQEWRPPEDYGYIYDAEEEEYVPASGCGYASTSNEEWRYYYTGENAYIIYYYGTDLDLTIPATVDRYDSDATYTVKGVGYPWIDNDYEGLFELNYYDYEVLEENTVSVTISEGIEMIGELAFASCDSFEALGSVTIPSTVTIIGQKAFEGSLMTSIEIPASVHAIDAGAFQSCYYLTSVTIRNPECEIFDYYDSYDPYYGWTLDCRADAFEGDSDQIITIYGYDDSTAEDYADNYEQHPFLRFSSLGPAPLDDHNVNGTISADSVTDSIGYNLSGFEYTKGRLLGAQVKTGEGNNLRFIAELSSDLISSSTDYGFEIAKTSRTTTEAFSEYNGFTAMYTAIAALSTSGTTVGKLTYHSDPDSRNIVKISCKGTSNNIVAGYGNADGEADTPFKYVTVSVDNIASTTQGFAIRFYVTDDSGTYYAKYGSTNYRGLCTNFSTVNSAVAG